MKKEDKTILFVDDEHYNLTAFKASFREDFTIHTALSANEGFKILEKETIRLVISDQRMPDISGVEFLAEVQKKYPETIRMVVTAYGDMNAIIDAINIGKVFYYIAKPWDTKEFKLIIDKAFSQLDLQEKTKRLEQEKQELLIQNERQEKEKLMSQLQNLRNQMKPHFLFNALSSLTGLIDGNPSLAKEFVYKLSRLYRYLLEAHAQDIVPLYKEILTLENYIFLQEVRFRGNMSYKNKVEIDQCNYKTINSGLLIFVENAIKHNVITKDNPLTLELYCEKEFIVLKNSYSPRKDMVETTKIGLSNLRQRSAILMKTEPEFEIKGDFYYAKLPITKDYL